MPQLFHFDSIRFRSKPERDPKTNFLRVDCTIGVTGVLTYQNPTGVRRELRTDEANQQLVKTIQSSKFPIPFTIEHPTGMVDSKNYSYVSKGSVDIGGVRWDAPEVVAPIIICDEQGIDAVLNQGKEYSSLGYYCNTKETPGIWNNVRFDACQEDIKPNHVCCTQHPRAGELARFHYRVDSNSDPLDIWWQIDYEPLSNRKYFIMPNEPLITQPNRISYQLGNATYQVPSDLLPLLERKDNDYQALKQRYDALESQVAELAQKTQVLEQERNDACYERDNANGTLDLWAEEVGELRQLLENQSSRQDSSDEDEENIRLDSQEEEEDFDDDEELEGEEEPVRQDGLAIFEIVDYGRRRFDSFDRMLQEYYPESVEDAMRMFVVAATQRQDAVNWPMDMVGNTYNEILDADQSAQMARTDSAEDIYQTVQEIVERTPATQYSFAEQYPVSIAQAKKMELMNILPEDRMDSVLNIADDDINVFHDLVLMNQREDSDTETDSEEGDRQDSTPSYAQEFSQVLNHAVRRNDMTGENLPTLEERQKMILPDREKQRAVNYKPRTRYQQ